MLSRAGDRLREAEMQGLRASLWAVGSALALAIGALPARAALPPNAQVTREALPGGGQRITIVLPGSQTPIVNAPTDPVSFDFTKAVDQHQAPLLSNLRYTFAVTNTGPSDLTGVLITDTDLVAAIANGLFEPFIAIDIAALVIPPSATGISIFISISIPDPGMTSIAFALVDRIGPGETFAWNLIVQPSAAVGTTIANQAKVQLECTDSPCTSPATLSDDPATAAVQDPTVITVAPPRIAPVAGPLGLVGLVVVLGVVGGRRLRREQSRHH
jgi:hypothetical protein